MALRYRICFSSIIIFALNAFSQSPTLYFPPITGNTWQTIVPSELGFCPEKIDSLYTFLEERGTKSFILLKDGRIVLEKYFGTFTQDSFWYWASAGKSLTAFLVGQAQEEGLLNIHDKTSTYLGAGWTSAPPDKEALVTIWHHLTMTTGLEDNVANDNCEMPSCLTYKADAGTRWAYHNAPYRLVHKVLEAASGQNINLFTKNRMLDRTGMKGLWLDHVMYGKARDMARFGLLMLANGVWDSDTLLHDPQYFKDMIRPSQNLNKSYGYLWWLNGQPSFMVPTLQFVFPGKLIPNAPDDMYAALGKNDQKIHVVPSKGWVVVRQGEAGSTGPGGGNVPIALDNTMWSYLNQLVCAPVSVNEAAETPIKIWPNPATNGWQIETAAPIERVEIFDPQGKMLRSLTGNRAMAVWVDAATLAKGVFVVKIITSEMQTLVGKAVKQ